MKTKGKLSPLKSYLVRGWAGRAAVAAVQQLPSLPAARIIPTNQFPNQAFGIRYKAAPNHHCSSPSSIITPEPCLKGNVNSVSTDTDSL